MTQTRHFLTVIATMLVISSPLHAGKIKCWTNSDGIRECGNVLPPEYAQQGHEEVNKQGMVTKRHERAKTKEELAEEKRLAEKKAEEERRLVEQYEKDKVLLQTFSSEDEIIMARDGKITAIQTELRLTRASLKNTKERYRTYHKQAANLERAGKPLTEKLLKDLKAAEKQIAEYETFIEGKQVEQERLTASFEKDMARYKKLKANPSLAQPPESLIKKQEAKNSAAN